MNITIIIILIIFMLYGLHKGFIKVLSYVAAISFGGILISELERLLANYLPAGMLGKIAIYGISLILIFTILILLGVLTEKFFENKPILKMLDKLTGTLFAGLVACILVGITYQILFRFDPQLINTKEVAESKIIHTINTLDKKIFDALPQKTQKKLIKIYTEKIPHSTNQIIIGQD